MKTSNRRTIYADIVARKGKQTATCPAICPLAQCFRFQNNPEHFEAACPAVGRVSDWGQTQFDPLPPGPFKGLFPKAYWAP